MSMINLLQPHTLPDCTDGSMGGDSGGDIVACDARALGSLMVRPTAEWARGQWVWTQGYVRFTAVIAWGSLTERTHMLEVLFVVLAASLHGVTLER